MQKLKQEKTLVLVKPDGVKRGLIGEIVGRIERRGLKVVALKMVQVGRPHLEEHFPKSDEWVGRLGDKGLSTFADYKLDPKEHLGTDDRMQIGKKVKESLFEYMTSGPIVAMVVQGMHSIDMVRKLAGHTLPFKADMGTLRGDFSVDSPAVANVEGRAIHNIMHASETPEEAANEINLWFKPEEIHEYKRAEEDVMF
ncbi:MAG: nucleoside-diphosphate kinase [Candidatus Doudnabacteria bacterium]|nr:nucleoside-diphosphate kinase [Candidatus Doudnabacteria bacterium]